MTDFTTIFEVLAKNGTDIEQLINKIGGVGAFIHILPNIIHIIETVTENKSSISDVKSLAFTTPATTELVKRFQTQHGLVADGYVGDKTWNVVERLLGH